MADGSGHTAEALQQARGLVIYRASRLSELLPNLDMLLAATRPASVLAPQTVIAAHPGIKHWLDGALAKAQGPGGIVANLQVMLPSTWIDHLARARLGQHAVALPRYRRQHLRWTIYQALGQPVAGLSDARITTYLRTEGKAGRSDRAAQARRRFQLADRLAGIYSQYLVYRSDWLDAWEQGVDTRATGGGDAEMASTERELLAPLWRHVRECLGAHRGEVMARLIGSLEVGASNETYEPLHVFGASHLAPAELAVLRAYARNTVVAMYVPDPCREYWGGLAGVTSAGDCLAEQRRVELARIDAAAGNDYWGEQTHPLLASWGRMGQHFLMSLGDGDGVLTELRSGVDEQVIEAGVAMPRLARVQQSIRELDTGRMVPPAEATFASERADASLRIHACHTRLRELEVLRDCLLDAIGANAGTDEAITPGDIIVMSPDINAYVPLLPAVFGPAGDSRAVLPYHLADVAVASTHPLYKAFQRLLATPDTRITTPEVVDLLGVPEIARRFGLESEGLQEVVGWLRESRVAWALDATFRQGFGVPGIAQHTFAWALDRLIAGYIMADGPSENLQAGVLLPDGIELAPVAGVCNPGAAHLGALAQLLQELQTLYSITDQTRTAKAWSEELERRVEAIFRVDPDDRAARDARDVILGFIRAIGTEPAVAGVEPELHFSVVRDLLAESLEAPPARQRFLLGGVTFCGMVPQRAIPFKVIAVLGLNDGEFPRSARSGGLDLMSRYRRLGDRDARIDDRYLFLETVMATGCRLHLSYIGEGVTDGMPRNPAAPLSEIMAALESAEAVCEWAASGVEKAPWHVKHPLQPFDSKYFGEDPCLFTHKALCAELQGAGDQLRIPAFLAPTRKADTVPLPAEVAVSEVHSYFKDPARHVLLKQMQIGLDALERDRLPCDEPLEAGFSAVELVERKLLFQHAMHPDTPWPLDRPPAWLRLTGLLPAGRAGNSAWRSACTAVDAMLEALRTQAGIEPRQLRSVDAHIDLDIRGVRVVGRVSDVFVPAAAEADCWHVVRAFTPKQGGLKQERDLHFKYRVPLFLDWALLRLQHDGMRGDPCRRIQPIALADKPSWCPALARWDMAFVDADLETRGRMRMELEDRVVRLLDCWARASDTPHWYFPKTSWDVAGMKTRAEVQALLDAAARDGHALDPAPTLPSVGSAWAGGFGSTGERDYEPGYSRLLAGDLEFPDGCEELDAMVEFARALKECISLDVKTEAAA